MYLHQDKGCYAAPGGAVRQVRQALPWPGRRAWLRGAHRLERPWAHSSPAACAPRPESCANRQMIRPARGRALVCVRVCVRKYMFACARAYTSVRIVRVVTSQTLPDVASPCLRLTGRAAAGLQNRHMRSVHGVEPAEPLPHPPPPPDADWLGHAEPPPPVGPSPAAGGGGDEAGWGGQLVSLRRRDGGGR